MRGRAGDFLQDTFIKKLRLVLSGVLPLSLLSRDSAYKVFGRREGEGEERRKNEGEEKTLATY